MKRRFLVFFHLILVAGSILWSGTTVRAGEIAITFEKLPFMEPLGFFTPREVSNMVLRTLKAEGVPAIGFVVEEKVEERPESFTVLQDWIEQGFLLGNATYSYVDLNEISADDFLTHVRDGHKSVRRLSRWVPGRKRYFRFPLLHEGNTPDKKKEVAKRLERADFILVPATVLVSDFEFNHLFEETSSDPVLAERLKALFLEHLAASLDYAEKQSTAVFGRQIPQILRLHLGVATASLLPDILDFLKRRNNTWISIDQALEDEAYRTTETYVGPLGLSFIDRVAATKGLHFDENNGNLERLEIRRRLQEETP